MTRRGASDPNLFARDVLKRIIAKHDPEGAGEISQSDETPSTATTTVMNIHGPNYGGIQQGTDSSTQNINIIGSPTISDILPQLKELLDSVRNESFPDKDDAIRDLEKAHQLALANPTASPNDGIWTRIQTKLSAAKTTMEIAGLTYKSLPYWPVVWDFFQRHA